MVKNTGDGALVEVCSSVMQPLRHRNPAAMAARNAAIPREIAGSNFRIGINVGDIIIDEGDIYGDGVTSLHDWKRSVPRRDLRIRQVHQEIPARLMFRPRYWLQTEEHCRPVRVYEIALAAIKRD